MCHLRFLMFNSDLPLNKIFYGKWYCNFAKIELIFLGIEVSLNWFFNFNCQVQKLCFVFIFVFHFRLEPMWINVPGTFLKVTIIKFLKVTNEAEIKQICFPEITVSFLTQIWVGFLGGSYWGGEGGGQE